MNPCPACEGTGVKTYQTICRQCGGGKNDIAGEYRAQIDRIDQAAFTSGGEKYEFDRIERMMPISQIGFTPSDRGNPTAADNLNAVIPWPSRPKCPVCETSMKVRLRKVDQAPFWACVGYPRCSGTKSIDTKKFTAAIKALGLTA